MLLQCYVSGIHVFAMYNYAEYLGTRKVTQLGQTHCLDHGRFVSLPANIVCVTIVHLFDSAAGGGLSTFGGLAQQGQPGGFPQQGQSTGFGGLGGGGISNMDKGYMYT